MILFEVYKRIRYCIKADRIGPDLPFTHWMLHFEQRMLKLCKQKFKYFHDTASFRPGAYAICCSKISLGKRVVIRPGTMLFADPTYGGAGITIDDNAMLGSGVHIYVGNHRFDNTDIPIIDQGHETSQGVTLKKGCWVGANAIILPGVVIGANSVIGAGSIVCNSIPENSLAVGNPAEVIRYFHDKP